MEGTQRKPEGAAGSCRLPFPFICPEIYLPPFEREQGGEEQEGAGLLSGHSWSTPELLSSEDVELFEPMEPSPPSRTASEGRTEGA